MRCDICGSENTFIRDCKYTISIRNKEVTIICQKRFCKDCNNEIIDEKLEKETLKRAEKRYNELYGLILAGGSGSRLWPMSRELYPKQLLKIVDKTTFFQATFNRLTNNINYKKYFKYLFCICLLIMVYK